MSEELLDEPTITASQVETYLKENLDFFESRADLLSDLKLPHPSGQAISLVEKQVAILREKNSDIRHHLDALIDSAKYNDELFALTKQLVLSLLDSPDLKDLADKLTTSLVRDFNIPFAELILVTDKPTHNLPRNIDTIGFKQAYQRFSESPTPISGALSKEEAQLIFAKDADNLGSAVVLAIKNKQSDIALLAIGHTDVEQYPRGTGTLFFSFIGDALGKLIPPMTTRD